MSFHAESPGIRRYTGGRSCPVCGGSEVDPRGQGRRCAGFLSDDGAYARCTREEHAGGLPLDTKPVPPCYVHRLAAECGCGRTHGPPVIGAATSPGSKRKPSPLGPVESRFIYRDAEGRPLIRVTRYRVTEEDGSIDKTFRQEHAEPDGDDVRWVKGLGGVAPVLYRLPELIASDPTLPVYVAEGEAKADAIRDAGFVATSNLGGAGMGWRAAYAPALAGRHVLILPDNDPPDKQGRRKGLDHAEKTARSLSAVAASVKVVELPDLPPKGDILDWIAVGRTVPEAVAIAEAAPLWRPSPPADTSPVEDGPTTGDDDDGPSDDVLDLWPTIDDTAFYGLAGRIVRAAEPHIEADPAAVLTQLLASFGNYVSRGPHVRVGAARHPPLLNIGLVGPTAAGRKGSAWAVLEYLLSEMDAEWFAARVRSGLVSGEGLIHAVRDATNGSDGKSDTGEPDKRLVVIEQEMSRVLKAMARDNNTLSEVIRKAWDAQGRRT